MHALPKPTMPSRKAPIHNIRLLKGDPKKKRKRVLSLYALVGTLLAISLSLNGWFALEQRNLSHKVDTLSYTVSQINPIQKRVSNLENHARIVAQNQEKR